MAITTETRPSRRAFLAAGVGGLAALAAHALGRPTPVRAGVDGDVVLGAQNSASDVTLIVNDTLGGIGFEGISRGTGPGIKGLNTNGLGVGVQGTSDTGRGIQGDGGSDGVVGFAGSGRGVWGHGQVGVLGYGGPTGVLGVVRIEGLGEPVPSTGHIETGVEGRADVSSDSIGVLGTSSQGTGIWGDATSGTGVAATGFVGAYGSGRVSVLGDAVASGTGVYGFTGATLAPLPPGGVGVQATAATTGQIALNVTGKARFSRSGRAIIGTGKSSASVTLAGVTSASLVFAEIQSNRSGRHVRAVVPTTGKFTIYLNTTVTAATSVAYFVLN